MALMELSKNSRLAVLMGGPGGEAAVSKVSGQAVAQVLREAGYQVEEIEVTEAAVTVPEEIDLCFNLIHGTYGEDGRLQRDLEKLGVAYTGAGAATSEVAFDKNRSKEVFVAHQVPTPAAEVLDCSAALQTPQMPVPFVVKPPREGSSLGIQVVKDPADVEKAIKDATAFSSDLLIEQFVEGRELTVGVVGGEVFPVVEIIPPDGEWYDMETKYPWLSGKEGGSQYVCPAALSEAEQEAVQKAALQAYHALGLEVYARVDVLLNAAGEPFVLEANTIPGMTESSLLPMGAKEAGYSFLQLCERIGALSLQEKRGSAAE